ncbi:toxin-antitoxin system toxin subunit [Streptomyces sp. WM6372]|uniref:DUF397 domain-containing protein n=1 Tax=Streptomyces sp. WM6372 TaxID=1415555 RepID=UPI0006ADC7C0|nr:DUF397 domain-containing protein [Streptomyces sp. WM6372]KOU21153.1 toxin-antitoxin system toxin subunit [Streptomyces sp. WM6372]
MSTELAWFKSSYSGGSGGECVEVALAWGKSSYSGGSGGDCVEVALPWGKSSHSGGDGGQCVEVAGCASAVHVRDSKDVTRPAFTVATAAWAAFTSSL